MKMKVLFLIAVLLGVLLFACAGAEKIGDYEYELIDDGTAMITAYIGQPTEELEIPSELVKRTKKNGETRVAVTVIGAGAFSGHKELTRVVIQDGIKGIWSYAFSDCDNLSEIIIPDGVVSIGDSAFNGCTALTEISIPNSVLEIGINPFEKCLNLTTLHLSPDHPRLMFSDGALYDQAEKRLICCLHTGITEYAVEDGTLTIGAKAFRNEGFVFDEVYGVQITIYCNLERVWIPDSVTEIGDWAFFRSGRPVVVVNPGSYAEQYCRENELAYAYSNSPDELIY